MVDESIIKTVREYFNYLYQKGLNIKFGVLYGSQVKGNTHKWSDIDLIVVSPYFDENKSRDKINILWRSAARVDNRIEAIPCGEKQWSDDDSSIIIEIARREGEIITP